MLMKNTEEKNLFSSFVNCMRRQQGLSMKQLCQGLCTFQELSYFENGQKLPNKLLLDAILERLGVGAEDYEHFLDYIEYDHWEARQQILHSITFEKIEEAEELLEKYRTFYESQTNPIDKKLNRQFFYSMQAQIKRMRGASREELYMLFCEAIDLTVPELNKKPLKELVLSIKELNLIIEQEYCRKEGERPERYQEVMEYIVAAGFDEIGRAKIYPKVVYFLCRSVMAGGKKALGQQRAKDNWTLEKLLKHCNCALELLRDSKRMYFLWEILVIRGDILKELIDRKVDFCEDTENFSRKFPYLYQENEQWKQMLEDIYREFHIPQVTFNYCYLYVMQGVQCINDIIRIRRRMLGVSRKILCQGICHEKTLQRLERRETTPQAAIVTELFERLGLSKEFTRIGVITDSQEAKMLMAKINDLDNARQWGQAKKLLENLEQMIDFKFCNNRQMLMRKMALSCWKQGEIKNEEYCRRMKEALELTLPYEVFLKEGQKYLTYEEQACIQNLMQGMNRESKEFWTCICRFEEYYRPYADENGMHEAAAGMYEFIMSFVGNEWGNCGNFDEADRYSGIILRNCLRLRRLEMLPLVLYDRWWNFEERKKRKIPDNKELDAVEELTKCVLASKLAKGYSQFYLKKLMQVKKE